MESSYTKDKWERHRYENLNSNINKSRSFNDEENYKFEQPSNYSDVQKKLHEGFKKPHYDDKKSNNLFDILDKQQSSPITPKKVKYIYIILKLKILIIYNYY
jgi:hypothetical protein